MDTIRKSDDGGDVQERISNGVESLPRPSLFVAPVFSDFAGKAWEHRYPDVMERYYGAVLAASRGGMWFDVSGVGCGSVAEDHASTVDGRLEFFADVGSRAAAVCGEARSDSGVRAVFNDVAEGRVGPTVERVVGGGKAGVGTWTRTALNKLERERKKKRKAEKKKTQRDDGPVSYISGKPAQVVAHAVNSSDVEGELKESVKRKWIAKNRLEALEAERKVAVLEANPVDSEVKAYRTRIGAATERNMVSMEKAHARLRATGNVASEPAGGVAVSGFAETVVDGEVVGGCTISPDSSASQSEFRASQKKVLDLEAKIERMEAAIKKLGLEPSVLDYYNKDEWTLDSQGEVGSEYGKVLDVMYPDGYAVDVPFLDYGERKGRVVPCISC